MFVITSATSPESGEYRWCRAHPPGRLENRSDYILRISNSHLVLAHVPDN